MSTSPNMKEWDNQINWQKNVDTEDGYTKIDSVKPVVDVRVSWSKSPYVISTGEIPINVIQKELGLQLGEKMVKEKLVDYHRRFDHASMLEVFTAEVTICPPGTKMKYVQDECFMVYGEPFTEEEIINALKQTYPDRLI